LEERVERRLAFWQTVTAGTLLVGYAGYYVCRSDLSVASPLILRDLGGVGIDKRALGLVTSVGIFAYAVGKVVNGVLGDFLGGRALFLLGMAGSILATAWFGASAGLGAFVLAWAVNRFVQSAGWGGLVKVASHWFPPERSGTIMGVLSLSFLFGDAVVRVLLGALIERGFSWRGVFGGAALVLAVIAAASALLLRSDPGTLGLPAPAAPRTSVFASGSGGESRPRGRRELLLPFLRRPDFYYVCLLSLGLTLIRETFNAWTPTFLVETFHMSQAAAASRSALFPFFGGISVLFVGALSDRFGGTNRVRVALPFLLLSTGALALLARPLAPSDAGWGLFLVGASAFLLIGPYTLLAGAIAIDLGGQSGSATAAGFIDSAGYLGGTLAGYTVGAVVEQHGWGQAFSVLAVIAALTTVVAFAYCRSSAPTGSPALEASP
jgi:OPA family glycerol-3-phosphate transporter-like MFS transporter